MTLALIAGRGALPAQVAQAQTQMPLICAMQGSLPDRLSVDVTFRLETLGIDFRDGRPTLSAWFDTFSARESMKNSMPKAH